MSLRPLPCAVTDLVALSIYVTKYATKSEKASESFLSVLNYAVGDAPDGGSAAGVLRKVAIRCLSTGLSKRVITNQEAAMSLLQMPVQRTVDVPSSERLSHISMLSFLPQLVECSRSFTHLNTAPSTALVRWRRTPAEAGDESHCAPQSTRSTPLDPPR